LELVAVEGLDAGGRFTLDADEIPIGRGAGEGDAGQAAIRLADRTVSSEQALLVRSERGYELRHRPSATNPTLVNGRPIDTHAIEPGDRIQIGRVVLEVGGRAGVGFRDLTEAITLTLSGTDAGEPTLQHARGDGGGPPGLVDELRQAIERDHTLSGIYRRHMEVGSLLDIDVVDSYGMKSVAERHHIIISFDRFRDFARRVVEEFHGSVLNCNGDELMCFFAGAEHAVRAAAAVIDRMDEFNEKENLLESPFQVRQGIHTGELLVDWQRGVAYSQVLDVAGHLQKHADPGGLLISDTTWSSLPAGFPFEPAGELEREGIPTHRLVGRA
jgi:class 3 adenylate cyclase